jgi:RNA polymerase sigma factor (sigma-70 family)
VRALARGLVGERQTAEAIAGRAFVEAWRELPSMPPGTSFARWLFAITRSTARTWRQEAEPSPASSATATSSLAPRAWAMQQSPVGSAPSSSSNLPPSRSAPPSGRAWGPAGPHPSGTAFPAAVADGGVPAGPERHPIEAGLAALDDEDREAFLLAAVVGLPYEEVAEMLECSQSTVATRVHRARRSLARALPDAGHEAGS